MYVTFFYASVSCTFFVDFLVKHVSSGYPETFDCQPIYMTFLEAPNLVQVLVQPPLALGIFL